MQSVKLVIYVVFTLFVIKMDGISEKIEQLLKELKEVSNEVKAVSNEVKGVSTKFNSLESKLNNFINKTDNEIQRINSNIRKVEESQQFISAEYDKHRLQQDNIIKSHSDIMKENKQLHSKVKQLENELKEEKTKRNSLEQHGRLNQVEISGVPLQDDEDCKKIVAEIAKLANAKVECTDIDVAHRLPGGGIIVQFASRTARDILFNSKSNLKGKTVKDLGLSPPKTKEGVETKGLIFINKGLTQETKSLLFETRKKCKTLNINRIWTNKGIIKVKGEHHPKPIRINCMDDVRKLN